MEIKGRIKALKAKEDEDRSSGNRPSLPTRLEDAMSVQIKPFSHSKYPLNKTLT